MAEYYARTNGNANMPKGRKHDASGVKWQGAKMGGLGDRLKHFAPGVGSAGEGLAGAGVVARNLRICRPEPRQDSEHGGQRSGPRRCQVFSSV